MKYKEKKTIQIYLKKIKIKNSKKTETNNISCIFASISLSAKMHVLLSIDFEIFENIENIETISFSNSFQMYCFGWEGRWEQRVDKIILVVNEI